MTARHSTGVAEPVPTVDDHLLREIGARAHVAVATQRGWDDWDKRDAGEALLASEPMVRLFSIWTATVAAQRDQYADQWETSLRERDEARALIAKLESNLDERTEQVFKAVEQRDEARTECESLRLFPPLPVAHARASIYPGGGVRAWLVGEPEPTTGWWSSREHAAKQAAIALAVVREFDRMDRDAKEGAARRREVTEVPTDDTLTDLGEDPR